MFLKISRIIKYLVLKKYHLPTNILLATTIFVIIQHAVRKHVDSNVKYEMLLSTVLPYSSIETPKRN